MQMHSRNKLSLQITKRNCRYIRNSLHFHKSLSQKHEQTYKTNSVQRAEDQKSEECTQLILTQKYLKKSPHPAALAI